jgi:hypothetical protein
MTVVRRETVDKSLPLRCLRDDHVGSVRSARADAPGPGDRGDGGALSRVGSAARCVAGGQRKQVRPAPAKRKVTFGLSAARRTELPTWPWIISLQGHRAPVGDRRLRQADRLVQVARAQRPARSPSQGRVRQSVVDCVGGSSVELRRAAEDVDFGERRAWLVERRCGLKPICCRRRDRVPGAVVSPCVWCVACGG